MVVDPRFIASFADDGVMLSKQMMAQQQGVAPAAKKHRPKKNGGKDDGPDIDLPPPDNRSFVDKVEGILFNPAVMIGMMAAPFGLKLGGKGANYMGWSGTGEKLAAAEKIEFNAVGKMTGLGRIFGSLSNAMMKVASFAVKPLEWIGVTNVMAGHYERQFVKHSAGLQSSIREAAAHAKTIGNTQLHSAITGLESHLAPGVHAMDFARFDKAMEGITAAAGKSGSKQLNKAVKNLSWHANQADISRTFGHGWGNLSEVTAGATKSMAKANFWHGSMNTTFVIGAGIQDYKDIVDLHKGLSSLKTMHCRLTGQREEDVSGIGLMWDCLKGNVSTPVRAGFVELLKEYGPATVLDAANTVFNIKFIAHSKFGSGFKNIALLLALPMASMMLAHGLLGGSLLPAYTKMKDAEAAGEQPTPEMVTKLIVSGSRTLHDMGGEKSNFTKALVAFYTEHHAKADTIIKEIDNGTMDKRIQEFQKLYQQHMSQQAHAPQPAAPQEAPHAAPDSRNVDRLNGVMPERKIVGPATERLHRSATEPQLSIPSPGMAW